MLCLLSIEILLFISFWNASKFCCFNFCCHSLLPNIQQPDGLVLYNEIGERSEANGSTALELNEDWVTEKKMWSNKVQKELGNTSRLIRNRIRQLEPHIEKGEVAEVFKRLSSIKSNMGYEPKTKRAKRSTMSKDKTDPKDLVGKRIAKRFPIDVGETTVDQLFFGTVKCVSHNLLKWLFICYDDGDSEDLGLEEVIEGINLYEVHKFDDPIHKDDIENSTSVIDSDSLDSLRQPKTANKKVLQDAAEDDGATIYHDMSTLFGLSASSNSSDERQISEFKEAI